MKNSVIHVSTHFYNIVCGYNAPRNLTFMHSVRKSTDSTEKIRYKYWILHIHAHTRYKPTRLRLVKVRLKWNLVTPELSAHNWIYKVQRDAMKLLWALISKLYQIKLFQKRYLHISWLLILYEELNGLYFVLKNNLG